MSQDHTPAPDADRTATMPDSGREARVVGHYRLLQKLGEGGMGEVWEAEQTEPVQRRVALKLIKRGMDSAQVIARFESERQALALMDHPSIAKVFDAGTTERGRPYFVMELVHGVPITDYCDRHRLSVRQRLELFIQVCEGIQHAHQKAIIHRDVKPSNILITDQDGNPLPKIIDFGVAKATAQRLTERTLFTELGQLIGTPEYMSPEQAELTGEDVDIRTDVYSLGMVLYELLVGALPFDPHELRQAGLFDLQRRIREDEPAKPSTRITRLGEASTLSAKNRRTSVPGLVRSLRGDLDWVVLKALDKDRNRRYEVAHSLTNDIQRFLRHETVHARPPSTAYRVNRFIGRHKVGVAAVTGFALLVLAFAATAWMQSIRIAKERDRATAEAEKAKAVAAFLQDTLSSADPYEGEGRDVTVTQVLESAVGEIDASLAAHPETRAAVQATIGVTYSRLGHYEQADALLQSALATLEELDQDHSAEATELLNQLAWVRHAQGVYDEAQDLYLRALRTRRAAGNNDLIVAESLNGLSNTHYSKGEFQEAEAMQREALGIRRQLLGSDHDDIATSLNDLALALARQERWDEAEPLYRESLEIKTRLYGEQHPAVAQAINNLGMFFYRRGDSESAEPLLRRALDLNQEIFGDEHPEVSTSLNNVALVVLDQGDNDEAAKMFERVLELDRKLLGEEHPYVAGTERSLGDTLMKAGKANLAQAHLEEAERIYLLTYDAEHPNLLVTRSFMGRCLTLQGRYAEAEALLLSVYPLLQERLGPSHRRTQGTVAALVELYEAWGRPDKAAECRALLAQD